MSKQREEPVAFVEGLDVSAYGISRSLGTLGVRVYALNDRLDDALRFSRYCRKCFLFPSDVNQQRTYRSDRVGNEEILSRLLLEWSAEFSQPPVLFATSDWFTRFLSNRGPGLSSRYRFHWVAPDLFATITDKGMMATFCQSAGVLIPRTHITQPNEDLSLIAREFVFPCLVKPIHRYAAEFPLKAAKVLVVNTAEELTAFFEKYPHTKGATLIQELIEGSDDQVFQCTMLVNSAGAIAAYSTVRKLRQHPAGYGSMCYGRTERNEQLVAAATKLVHALGYRGLGSLEFKYRERDRSYYFIEMNARLPWYNGIFADAGINLANLAYRDLTAQEVTEQHQQQREGVVWASFEKYSNWFWETRKRDIVGIAEFAGSVARANSYAWWNWTDPAPFLASSLGGMRSAVGKMLRRLKRQ